MKKAEKVKEGYGGPLKCLHIFIFSVFNVNNHCHRPSSWTPWEFEYPWLKTYGLHRLLKTNFLTDNPITIRRNTDILKDVNGFLVSVTERLRPSWSNTFAIRFAILDIRNKVSSITLYTQCFLEGIDFQWLSVFF